MDLTSEPPQKRRKISNDVCIICEQPLDRGATYKTVVLYQRNSNLSDVASVPRTVAKLLNVSEYKGAFVQRYAKPHKQPEPPRASSLDIFKVTKDDSSYLSSLVKDLIWQLTRKVGGDTSSVPAWSGYNALLSDLDLLGTTIRYLAFIPAPRLISSPSTQRC